MRRQDGGGILCLWVSSNTRISLKKSVNAPVKILCRLRLLQLGVKAELQIWKKEFPLAVCGTERRIMGKTKRKGWRESYWPDPQSHLVKCNEWRQPKAWGQISVCLSWCGLRLKKTTIIWEWWKVFLIGTKHKEIWQMLKWAIRVLLESSVLKDIRKTLVAKNVLFQFWLTRSQWSGGCVSCGCHIQVWWLQLTSIWSRYELPRRPQLLHKPVAQL